MHRSGPRPPLPLHTFGLMATVQDLDKNVAWSDLFARLPRISWHWERISREDIRHVNLRAIVRVHLITEETNTMEQTNRHHEAGRRILGARMATAALVIGGLSASFFAASVAGAATGASVVISTTKNAKLGTILVSGTTLYTLKTSKTPCTAQCLKVWPAVLLPKGMTSAAAGKGVSAAKLGTVKRSGGTLQVTYSGKPLYRFSGDKATGQVNGNVTDTWGKWSSIVTAKPAQSGSGSSVTSTTSPSSGGASF